MAIGFIGVGMAICGFSSRARAQQVAPEHMLRLTDQDINTIRNWGFDKPFKESADVLSKIFQQLQVEQMQRDAQAQANARATIENDLKAKEEAAKKAAEPAK